MNDSNFLEVECRTDEGEQAVNLELWVNEELAAEGTDSENPLPAGAVALFAATFKDAEKAVEADFDDLNVSEYLV